MFNWDHQITCSEMPGLGCYDMILRILINHIDVFLVSVCPRVKTSIGLYLYRIISYRT